MKGFYGKILTIDLTNESIHIDTVEDEILATYLGAKGLGSYLLYRNNPEKVDALDPDNCLIFACGPVTGSSVWGSCRYGVFTKSPLTGLYSESYSGGRVPEAVDAAGFDAIVIRGKSKVPSVISIDPDNVAFHDATDLWGKDTFESEDIVRERFARHDPSYSKCGAVVIGPAGENLVNFAVIENDYWRSAGRTGVGAVMGSKNLKGIVFQGDRKRQTADPEAVRAFSRKIASIAKDNAGVKAYKAMGTSMMVKTMNEANTFPSRYWTEGSCEHWPNISADALHGRCDVSPHACLKCMMACGRLSTVRQGRHAGMKIEGPEYETLYAFGGLCMVDSIEEIIYLNHLCDRLGVDTITAGNLCAFTIEAVRRGKVDYSIDYGDVDAIAGLIEKMVRREGIGAILAEGIRHAARVWDLEDLAVHVKGLEPAGYDPRVLKGMGLAYATSDRGACHLRSTFYKAELSGMIPKDQIEGKAELFIDFEDRLTLFDTLILCRFYRDLYLWDELEEMVRATTGLDVNKTKLQAIAASVSNLVRRFNIREGLKPEDDRLPKKFYEKMEKTGHVITEDQLNVMIRDYYRLRGWNEHGIPERDA